MSVRLVARPIQEWPDQLDPTARQEAQFSATWTQTVDLLEREVRHLAGRGDVDVVLQLAVTDRELRQDGWIRADARPSHPGVILSFDSKHGPLRYSTDRFSGSTISVRRGQPGSFRYDTERIPGWQCNVRAIALGLEALRKVDRYGITRGGEQYRGWNALGSGAPMPPAQMTVEEAAQMLVAYGEVEGAPMGDPWDMVEDHPARREIIDGYYRRAAKRHHPDHGGDPDQFRRLTEARDLLAALRSPEGGETDV